MELLLSRSRSQQRVKMSVNVCFDDIFYITEHVVTKFGMVMQHHEPEACRIWLLLLLTSRSWSQRGLIWSKYDSFYYIIWIVDSLATILGLMIHHQKPECSVKKKGYLHPGLRYTDSSTLTYITTRLTMGWGILPHKATDPISLWGHLCSPGAVKRHGFVWKVLSAICTYSFIYSFMVLRTPNT